MQLYTFCVDIGRHTQQELLESFYIMNLSLNKYIPKNKIIVYTNFATIEQLNFPNVEIRNYYDNQEPYYEGQDSEWLNLSFNKLAIWKDLYDETGEEFTWVDLDTVFLNSLDYLADMGNYFVATGGNEKYYHPLFHDTKRYEVRYDRYIQGNLWKLNYSLYERFTEVLENLNKENMKLMYDCQALFNYCYHYLDYNLDMNILGLNLKSDKIFGLGVWTKGKVFSNKLLFDVVEKNGCFMLNRQEIHLWSLTFKNQLTLKTSKKFYEIISKI